MQNRKLDKHTKQILTRPISQPVRNQSFKLLLVKYHITSSYLINIRFLALFLLGPNSRIFEGRVWESKCTLLRQELPICYFTRKSCKIRVMGRLTDIPYMREATVITDSHELR